TVEDRLNRLVHNLRCSGAVGVHEVMTLIGIIISFNVTVTKRQLDSTLVRLLAAKLDDAFLNRSIHRSIDSVDGFGIVLRNQHGYGIFLCATIDADRLPTVEVRKTSVLASDNLSSVYVCHNFNPP